MVAARKSEDNYFSKYNKQYVQDENELLDEPVKFPTAKRIKGLTSVFNSVVDNLQDIYGDGKFPVVLAADHGSAGGTIAGIKKQYPNKRLGVVWIDAHGDLHTPYTTPSGNMHGMPLATALGVDNKECKRNDPNPEVVKEWENLKNAGVPGVKLQPEDLVFIGVRDTEPEEDALIKGMNITNHTVAELREKGAEEVLKATLDQLKDCDILYISFDVDSMDPEATSHGTGTPVPIGLAVPEAEELLNGLCSDARVVCLEIVEVNPCLDEHKNKMAEVTFGLLKSVSKVIEG